MTNLDLDKLEQLHAKATVGDWETLSHGPSIEDSVITYSLWSNEYGDMLCEDISDRDADWVTAIHNAAPALIAELREARGTIERVRAITDEFGEPWGGAAFNLWSDIRAALPGRP